MADDAKPKVGDLTMNFSHMTYLIDVETTQGLQTEKEGLHEVLAEIRGNQKEYGALARITDQDIAELDEIERQIQEIDESLPSVEKLQEMMKETRKVLVDRRERKIHKIANLVDNEMKEKPELGAKYQRTRKYRSLRGRKAAQTRQQRAEAQSQENPEPQGQE